MTPLIRTCVFLVAGRGTRFLPATKATPKEMLTVVDKPLIQYAVAEALEAGATNLVFITGSSKRTIEDHFEEDPALEALLEAQGKHELAQSLRDILPSHATCIYIRQAVPLGTGHAVLLSRPVVGDEPFYIHLCDDLIDSEVGCLSQMRDVHGRTGGSVIGVEPVDRRDTGSYGVVDTRGSTDPVARVHAIVEKPDPAEAPSNLAVVGRYLFTPRLFDYLVDLPKAPNGEIQLTDAIAALLTEELISAYQFEGTRYDCGTKLGFLQANVDYALKHPTLGPVFAQWLATREVG